MTSLRVGNLLMIALMGAAVNAEPPRRPQGPVDDGPAMEGRPRGRFGPGDARGAPRGPGGPEGPPPVPWDRIPENERKKISRFMEEHFPRMALESNALRDRAPRQYNRRMTRIGVEMHRLMEVMEHDPQRGLTMIRERQLAIQIRQSVMDYHRATNDAQRDELRIRIQDLANQEFQVRLERRADEVRQMETRLASLRSRLSEMEALRGEIVERHVRDMLEKPPHFRAPDRSEGSDDFDEPDDRPPPPPPNDGSIDREP